MKKGLIGCGLACLLALWPVVAAGEEGAASLDAAWVKAMKANDAQAVAACYASDAVLWFPDSPEARGAKAIHDAYVGFLAGMTVQDVAVADALYQTSGDLSAGWGHFTMRLQPKSGGDSIVMKGRFLETAKRIGGRWLYVADLASLEPPPQPAVKP